MLLTFSKGWEGASTIFLVLPQGGGAADVTDANMARGEHALLISTGVSCSWSCLCIERRPEEEGLCFLASVHSFLVYFWVCYTEEHRPESVGSRIGINSKPDKTCIGWTAIVGSPQVSPYLPITYRGGVQIMLST